MSTQLPGVPPQEQKSQPSDTPGKGKTTMHKIMEVGTGMMQSFAPIKQIDMHLSGFAFYNGQPDRQVELHHYCSRVNDEVTQCAVYESDKSDARLLGVEYVISERLFRSLPEDEQIYWHSHATDIKSASFIAPGLPETMQRPLAQELANTYGKTFLMWQVDRGDVLPLGPPQLMMVCTRTEQWKPELFAHRDQRLGIDSEKIREARKDLDAHPVQGLADHWTTRPPLQCCVTPVNK